MPATDAPPRATLNPTANTGTASPGLRPDPYRARRASSFFDRSHAPLWERGRGHSGVRFFPAHGTLSLHPRLPGRLPRARGPAAARADHGLRCRRREEVQLVLERRVWRQLVAALFGQHGDAGASQPRSHAGAWQRSMPAMVVGAARVVNRRPECLPVIGGSPNAGGCGR